MIKKIRTAKKDKKLLTTVCKEMDPADKKTVRKVFRDLQDTAESVRKHCLGLSANQIGFSYRAFVMLFGTRYIGVMNPEIVKGSDKMTRSRENCLSLPGESAVTVMRHKRLTVEFTDPRTGSRVKRKLAGKDAIVFQHELDHSNGILI